MIKKNINSVISKIRENDFIKEYIEIKSISNEDKLLEFKEKYLKKLLLHAYKHVPYYHGVLKDAGVVHDKIVELSRFNKIPILTKERIGNETLSSSDYTKRKWYRNYSGGSTGEPTRFIQDEGYRKWINATNEYYYQDMLGIDERNVRKIILWGSERDLFKGSMGLKTRIGKWLTNTILLNSFAMEEKNIGDYLKTIDIYKPDLIRGYAGSLYELCRYAERKNMEMHSPKIIVSSAETLNDEMREKIEIIFGTKLYDFYGSRETASLAGECKYGLMHIFEFNNYIEILDKYNNPVEKGKEGRIIVTNLHNYSMPFIRYELGDMAVLGPKKCKCGNILPTLQKIHGRIEEQFIRKDGNIVIGYFFVHLMGVVYNKGFIKKFQVIQEDYDRIRILAVTNGTLPDSEKKNIEDKIKLQMGQDCKVTWSFVDEIPKTKSGKYLYTKSLLNK